MVRQPLSRPSGQRGLPEPVNRWCPARGTLLHVQVRPYGTDAGAPEWEGASSGDAAGSITSVCKGSWGLSSLDAALKCW